mmetsp:Transcript_155/g.221  ORF Transcript_155/g.221 Transcript_155/m.221 type:complete len:107 (+) Transcript_155:267-587(+)
MQFSLPFLKYHLKAKYAMRSTRKMTRKEPSTTKPTVFCSKSAEIPNRAKGIRTNTTTIYTMGKSFPKVLVALPSALAALSGTLLMNGIGYHMMIPLILKNRWHRAT